ncbi:unnamed protein product [Mycena citricolor]|uniref:Carboxylic ester hydrolase n=1 Tax=Mycena citricolor TaxID=2018698 RepID=A0AAD2H1U7_9AGAR|nr:unnamed protein product [Mycena citricolor]
MAVSPIYRQLLALLLLPTLGALAAPNVVNTGYASYRGNLSFPNTVAYLGIPYAEPPLGNLRFRAPLPLDTGRVKKAAGGKVVDATQYPEFCVQGSTGNGDAGGAGSEDCLKVNVYTPANVQAGDDLPVLVYIHGGGYIYGNPRNWPFDPWVHQSPDVVIVSVYYRLSAFGFLSTPEFSNSANGDFNVGFQDQIEALKWVQSNIHAFGGDKNKVTINGESAGGASVELHSIANVHPNFQGIIAQSVYRTPLAHPAQRAAQFQLFATQAGCGTGSVKSQLACLRSASVSALARAQDFVSYNANTTGYKLFQPVVDGKIFLDYPTKLITEGKIANVPIIVGSTSNETLSGGTITSALLAFFPSYTNKTVQGIVNQYPLSDFASAALQFQAGTGEPELLCARHIIGTAASKKNKAWTYRYNQANPTGNPGLTRVDHAAENWMMFQGSNTGTNGTGTFSAQTPVELAFTRELIAYWLSFVRSGNPNTHKLHTSPNWPQFSSAQKNRIVLQQNRANDTTKTGSFLEVQSDEETERCQFVVGQVAVQQA